MPHTRHLELPSADGEYTQHPPEVRKFISKVSIKHTKQISVHHTNTHGQNRPAKTPMDGCSVTVDRNAPLVDQLLPSDLGRCVSLYLLDTNKKRLKSSVVKEIFRGLSESLRDEEFVPDIEMLSENLGQTRDSRTWTPSSGECNSGKTRISLLQEKTPSKKFGTPTYYLLVSSFPGKLGSDLKKYLLDSRESHGISTFGQLAQSPLLEKHISICLRSNDRLAFKVMQAMGIAPSNTQMDLREPRHANIAERFYPKPVHANVLTTVRDADGYLAEVNEPESSDSDQSEEQEPAKKSSKKQGYRYDSGSDEGSSSETSDDEEENHPQVKPPLVMAKLPKHVTRNPVEHVPGRFVRIYYGVSDPNPMNALSGHPEHALPHNHGIIVSGGIFDNVRVYPYPLNAQRRVETPFMVLSTEAIGENSAAAQKELSKNVHYEGKRMPKSVGHHVRHHKVLGKNEVNKFETETGLNNALKLGHVASWTN